MIKDTHVLDSLVGRVQCYGMDVPTSLNEIGEEIIYLTDKDKKVVGLSMDLFMKHKIFTTFSQDVQLKLSLWYRE